MEPDVKNTIRARRSSCSLQLLLMFLLLVVVLLLNTRMATRADTSIGDVDALKALYNGWLQQPSSWDTSTDPCNDQWLGIWCNDDQTRVTGVLLIDQNLEGTISPFIGNLTRLVHLDLSSNPMLGGTIPSEIAKLERLERFFIQNCNLSGAIPSEIGNMSKIQYFGLTDNNLVGALPPTIGLLVDMNWLDVAENRLSGTLPVSNSVSIGAGLDNLTKARHFHLEKNEFSGIIPSTLFNTRLSLIHILLYDNALFGGIPSTISDLLHVEIIRLDQNLLNGTIPSTISAIQNLTTLQVDHNEIIGRVPDLSNSTKLQILTIGNNPFDPSEIPTWLTQLASLRFISMDSANLIGDIPTDLFRSKPSLTNVSLASNQLNGTLNLTIADAPLIMLNLTDNEITDVEIGNYTDVIILEANPYCEAAVSSRACTGNSSGMQNQAPAPTTDSSGSTICTEFCFGSYVLNPKLINTSSYCVCKRPVIAYCRFYAVKVPILSDTDMESAEARYVTRLNENNAVQGSTIEMSQVTVQAIAADVMLVSVFPPVPDTSWSSRHANNLSYAIKNQDIQFPSIGPMSCEYTTGPYDDPTTPSVKALSLAAKIGIGLGATVFAMIALAIGLYAARQRKRAQKAERLNKPFAAWIESSKGDDSGDPNIPQMKGARWFSLEELRVCTNNFDVANEIGEGGYGKVYKGVLSSGEEVAIKRARADSLQGAPEFKKEIEVLSRVHHRNLVGLIGFCFESGEQMLVYEFMSKGTLRDYLSGRSGLEMDLYTRIRLSLESARGIAYLHNEANPPIIHRDIKSTNILLDKRSVAKVADFGLCKLAPDADEGMIDMESTNIRGTMGYLDPEYFLTSRLTDKSDVYSFGVVLLELITGRSPFQEGRYIVHEVKTTLEINGIGSLLGSLSIGTVDEPKKCIERLVDIALACVEERPSERFSILEVVKELESLLQECEAALSKTSNSGDPEKVSENLVRSQMQLDQNLVAPNWYDSDPSFGYSGTYLNTSIQPK